MARKNPPVDKKTQWNEKAGFLSSSKEWIDPVSEAVEWRFAENADTQEKLRPLEHVKV